MFDDSRVLGVDPGLASCGVAVLSRGSARPEIVWADCLRTPSGLAEAARLRVLHDAVSAAIREHVPGTLAVERVMWGKNVGSAMSVARATGVILLAASEAGIQAEEYAPLEVKMAVVGVGNAPKDAVRRALVRTHGLDGVPDEPNAVDAVAIALCHLQQSRLRKAVRV